MNKKQLEILISQLKGFENPKLKLCQYTTPSWIVADIVNIANLSGEIKGKKVVDFCTGTGFFAIAAAVYEPKIVIALDIDKEALRIAKQNKKLAEQILGKKLRIRFLHKDIFKYKAKAHTLFQNPPFAIEAEVPDIKFLQKAMEVASIVYSFHQNGRVKNRNFIAKIVEANNGEIVFVKKYSFPIPHQFSFHRKPKVKIEVDVYKIKVKI